MQKLLTVNKTKLHETLIHDTQPTQEAFSSPAYEVGQKGKNNFKQTKKNYSQHFKNIVTFQDYRNISRM